MTIEVNGLHHFLIRVQDPDASRAFYEQTFGFSFVELPVDADFVRAWRGHPSEGKLLATPLGDTFLVLAPPLEGTADDDRFNERRVGVDHLAFGVPNVDALQEVVAALELAGVRTAGVEHDPVLDKSYVAFRDPDNVQWEFYASA
jgi:glyoxylase I family protein